MGKEMQQRQEFEIIKKFKRPLLRPVLQISKTTPLLVLPSASVKQLRVTESISKKA